MLQQHRTRIRTVQIHYLLYLDSNTDGYTQYGIDGYITKSVH